jgi:thymidylate synthase (FAD)
MPIFVARQWVRHRTARLNEISGRYSIMKDEFYVPDADQMRVQSEDNKQARGDEMLDQDLAAKMLGQMRDDQELIYKNYREMIDAGLAREIARSNLPLSLYTEWYWQIDLHNLFHFLRLRMDHHAQYEIRVFADAMAQCAKAVAPLAYEAFEDHILGSVRFSKEELRALDSMLAGEECPLEGRTKRIFEEKLDQIRQLKPNPPTEDPLPPSQS